MLSDELTVEGMKANLLGNGYRFTTLVESIVTSPQFVNKRSVNTSEQKRTNVGDANTGGE